MTVSHKVLLIAALSMLGTTAARAQTASIPEGQGVADRPRPDYLPIGGRVGSFFIYPVFGVSAEASDNVLATNDDREEDVYFLVSGKAKVRSNFSRHALNLELFGDRSIHARLKSEDVTRYGAQIDGLYDISRDTQVMAMVRAQRGTEARTSFNSPPDAREPSRFEQVSASLAAKHSFGRLDLTATMAVRSARYDAVALRSGGVVDQRFRDADIFSGEVKAAYRLREGASLLLRASAEKADYILPADSPAQPGGFDRDSKGTRLEGGVRFDLTNLLYGEARVGYFKRDYADPRFKDSSGLSFGADLLWNVTPLTSLRLGADRRIDEASSTTIAGNRTTEFEASVDHELRRNVILSANALQRRIKPLGPVAASKEFQAGLGARYLANRQLSFRFAYRHARRSSQTVERSYRENYASLSALLTF